MRFIKGQTRRKLPKYTTGVVAATFRISPVMHLALRPVSIIQLERIAADSSSGSYPVTFFAYDAKENEIVIYPPPKKRIDIVVCIKLLRRI